MIRTARVCGVAFGLILSSVALSGCKSKTVPGGGQGLLDDPSGLNEILAYDTPDADAIRNRRELLQSLK